MSVAASDSMVSSKDRAASATMVREGGGRKKSISREPELFYARKSRVESTSSGKPRRSEQRERSSTHGSSPKGMARDHSISSTCGTSPKGMARDRRISSTRAHSPKGVARDSSTSGDETSSDSEEDSNASGIAMGEATKWATVCLETLIQGSEGNEDG
jgi:hypothetical protein